MASTRIEPVREAEVLYLFVVGLYLLESLVIVPVGAVVVARGLWRWRVAEPLVLRGGAGPAVTLAFPAPPLGLVAAGSTAGRLALTDARERVAAFARASWDLRVAESALFLAVFGGGATLVWWDAAPDLPALAAMGSTWLTTALFAVLTRRRLAPEARPPWGGFAIGMLSPISAIRLHDVLGKRVFADLDGLAVAAAMLPPGPRAEVMRRALARATHGRGGDPAAIAALAEEAGLDLAALRAAPERDSARALAWCPICRDQFVRYDETCATCGDVPLERF